MADELESLLAKRFIARRDAKAVQTARGEYHLHTADGKRESPRLPWKMGDLRAHVAGTSTFGHYLLDQDSRCKLFAFDIDLEKTGYVPSAKAAASDDPFSDFEYTEQLRSAWLDRTWHGRTWIKFQLRRLSHKLAGGVHHTLGLPCAVAYTGSKGVHVYGFTGLTDAADAREGAQIVLDSLDEFKLVKGMHFYKHRNEDPEEGFANLSIEVFPKQSSLDGKDLGNLLRLPLGRNRKSKDPTFFVDMRSPMAELVKRDPIEALTNENPWR